MNLAHRVEDIGIGELAIRSLLHLLHLGLGVIEREGEEGGQEPSDSACPKTALEQKATSFYANLVDSASLVPVNLSSLSLTSS